MTVEYMNIGGVAGLVRLVVLLSVVVCSVVVLSLVVLIVVGGR